MPSKAAARGKRRSRPSLRRRLRTFWILGAVLAAGAVYGLYRLESWPGFRLARVDVRGLHVVARADVLAHAALNPHANVWLMNLRGAERRIEAIPYVERARLHRIAPASLAIDVVERAPDGCALVGGEAGIVDASGRVLALGCEARPAPIFRLPGDVLPAPGAYVRDHALSRMQGDAERLARANVRVASLAYDRFGGLDATLANGVVVQFGEEGDLDAKARLVDPILRTVASRSKAVAGLDLRAPGTPVVSYRR